MKLTRTFAAALALFAVVFPTGSSPGSSLLFAQAAPAMPTPSQFLGFEVGADRKLADYRQIVSYFKELANRSRRIEIENMGPSTLGNDFIIAVISSEENLRNKKRYQEIARKLADPRGLSPQQVEALVKEGKTILLVTCNIHSTEIGSTQMAMEWAHALVSAQDAETKRRLNEVILLLVPSLNPDGQIMVTEWYRKYVGTPYEGIRLPYLYHHYVGHDNNRDWYMLTQKETIGMNRAVYQEWFPQIWLDEHQMGPNGARLFVPPYTDPIAPAIDPLVWRGVNVIGANMAWRLEQAHKAGVVFGAIYDGYWPGGTEDTGQFKNIFGALTEMASVRIATPIYIPPGELSGGSKGFVEYGVTANFPNPWPGGWWRLRDIMDYERIASDSILETAANRREDFLRGVAEMAMNSVRAGKAGEYWRIPRNQTDPVTAARLAFLMREHGAEVVATKTDFLIPTAQPYGRFVTEMMSKQRYPKVKAVTGPNIIPPYDMTAWSLPLMMGVSADKVVLTQQETSGARPLSDADWPQGALSGSGAVYALSHQVNNSFRLVNELLKAKGSAEVAKTRFDAGGVSYPAGTFLVARNDKLAALAAKFHVRLDALGQKPNVATSALREVRLGLYKPFTSSMDEGWTRWVLEQYGFDPKSVDNKTVKGGNLNAAYDVIVIADSSKEMILEGKPRSEGAPQYWEELPPEYAGGIGKDGAKNLKEFIDKGGTLITLAAAGDLVEEFNVPVRNALARVRPEEFSVPGSLLRVRIEPDTPVTYGMAEDTVAFVNSGIAYQTQSPPPSIQRTVLAAYPNDAEDILVSGWIRGAEMLQRRAAAVAFTINKGKLVMFGFRVQHRAQTENTFKMLFNAIEWGGMSDGGYQAAAGSQ